MLCFDGALGFEHEKPFGFTQSDFMDVDRQEEYQPQPMGEVDLNFPPPVHFDTTYTVKQEVDNEAVFSPASPHQSFWKIPHMPSLPCGFSGSGYESDASVSSIDTDSSSTSVSVEVESGTLVMDSPTPDEISPWTWNYVKQEGSPSLDAFTKSPLPVPCLSLNKYSRRLLGYRKVVSKHTPGKKPKVKVRWHLLCGHCNQVFMARPTPKNSRYVVNHICPKHHNKRRQFVIGVKTRRCLHKHSGPCIQRLLKLNEDY